MILVRKTVILCLPRDFVWTALNICVNSAITVTDDSRLWKIMCYKTRALYQTQQSLLEELLIYVLRNAAIIPVKWLNSSVGHVIHWDACITVNHRQCEKVVHIPDIVKEKNTTVEFTEFDKILETIAKELNEHKEKIASNTEANIQMKKNAKDELKQQRNEINKFFDDLEKKMDLEIEHIQKDNSAALKAASDKLV